MNTNPAKTTRNLQDSFLNHVRKENLGVIIYLMNGFQIRGLVRGFDNFAIIMENEGKQQLVYKHAISTISPADNITIMQPEKKDQVYLKNGA
ncbi:MAG: RNA chaperone Hfq [Phascolarctobacterium sp.]|nr:RNA chaperone Hfq [Phascolarctobacterium sp.]